MTEFLSSHIDENMIIWKKMMGNKRGMKALESRTMVRNKTNQIVKNTVQN
jgi:hypothetical protein